MDLLVIIAVVLVLAGAVIGASYVFAITAEREPEPATHMRRPTTVR